MARYLKKLLCAGVDTALFEPGAGQPEPVRLCRAAEALPRGGIIEIEGREHSITEGQFQVADGHSQGHGAGAGPAAVYDDGRVQRL